MTLTHEISKTFNRRATEYEAAAKVQLEIGHRLFERLSYLKINPQRILDLGCGPGIFSRLLAERYPKAHIVGLDIAPRMLREAKKKRGWWRKWSLLGADMEQMPFADASFDLVFANQAIHWGKSLAILFNEVQRVMTVNACFMFTTLGPDTFKELKTSWATVNHYAHINHFPDMHDVGDALLQQQFVEPVMDMELLTVHYPSLPGLLDALKKQGVRNINKERNPGLTGKQSWQQFRQNYRQWLTEEHKYPLTYEVVYGHAWKGQIKQHHQRQETWIPIAQIMNSKSSS